MCSFRNCLVGTIQSRLHPCQARFVPDQGSSSAHGYSPWWASTHGNDRFRPPPFLLDPTDPFTFFIPRDPGISEHCVVRNCPKWWKGQSGSPLNELVRLLSSDSNGVLWSHSPFPSCLPASPQLKRQWKHYIREELGTVSHSHCNQSQLLVSSCTFVRSTPPCTPYATDHFTILYPSEKSIRVSNLDKIRPPMNRSRIAKRSVKKLMLQGGKPATAGGNKSAGLVFFLPLPPLSDRIFEAQNLLNNEFYVVRNRRPTGFEALKLRKGQSVGWLCVTWSTSIKHDGCIGHQFVLSNSDIPHSFLYSYLTRFYDEKNLPMFL